MQMKADVKFVLEGPRSERERGISCFEMAILIESCAFEEIEMLRDSVDNLEQSSSSRPVPVTIARRLSPSFRDSNFERSAC